MHPNKAEFRGTLCHVDTASDKAPAGARGHKFLLKKSVIEQALPSIVGMGVNFDGAGRRHSPTKKVGIITDARIIDKDVLIEGYIFAYDFPEVVEALSKKTYGLSYEICDVLLEDIKAYPWIATSFVFTGVAIMDVNKVAYKETEIHLIQPQTIFAEKKGEE